MAREQWSLLMYMYGITPNTYHKTDCKHGLPLGPSRRKPYRYQAETEKFNIIGLNEASCLHIRLYMYLDIMLKEVVLGKCDTVIHGIRITPDT